MINLSLDKLRLIGQSINISDYKNKSKEDLKKALIESELKPEPKPEPKPKPKRKPKPEPKPKLKPEPKIEIKVNRKKLEKLRKDFNEWRHKFSNKDEIGEYRKSFYNAKKYKFFESETEEVRKNVNKLKKSLKSKKFHVGIHSVDYEDLNNCDYNMILLMMINAEKLEVLEHYLKNLIVIISNQ